MRVSVVTTMIQVRLQFEGQHCWPEAPDQVDFLRSPHRHMFHVRVRMNVQHSDRELEFILVKRDLQKLVDGWGFDLRSKSCENMALEIMLYLDDKYKRGYVEVEVNEDGENGAVVHMKEQHA